MYKLKKSLGKMFTKYTVALLLTESHFSKITFQKLKSLHFFKIKPYWSPHHLLTLCFLINSKSHI